MKIFVLEATDFLTGIRLRSLHATAESMNKAAADLANMLLDEVEMLPDATPQNWQDRVRKARLARCAEVGVEPDMDSLDEDPIGEALGDDNGDVWFTEEEVMGA